MCPVCPLCADRFGAEYGILRHVISFYQLQVNANYHFWETFHLTSDSSSLTHSALQNKMENFSAKSEKKLPEKANFSSNLLARNYPFHYLCNVFRI